MISRLSDLLDVLRAKEAGILNKRDINHAPIIDATGEDVPADVLNRLIPSGLTLGVVEGFVDGLDEHEANSGSILLVRVEGNNPLSVTEGKTWPLKNVLAILDIRRNLYSSEIDGVFSKMHKNSSGHHQCNGSESYSEEVIKLASKNFARMTGYYPTKPVTIGLSEPLFSIHQAVISEHLCPVRIVLSYGQKAESLQIELIGLLNSTQSDIGAGYQVLPSLMIGGNYAAAKNNLMPYCCLLEEDSEDWATMGLNVGNPIQVLLEALWARINLALNIDASINDPASEVNFNPFVYQRITKNEKGIFRSQFFAYSNEMRSSADALKVCVKEPGDTSKIGSIVQKKSSHTSATEVSNLLNGICSEDGGATMKNLLKQLVQLRLFAWTDMTRQVARPIDDQVVTLVSSNQKMIISDQKTLANIWEREQFS